MNITLWLEGCNYDVDLGNLPAPVSSTMTTMNTTAGADLYQAACGGGLSGLEHVTKFHIDTTSLIEFEWANQVGNHVFVLAEEAGGACDDAPVTCTDTFGLTSGSDLLTTLTPGDYIIITDAVNPGDEGTIDLTINLY